MMHKKIDTIIESEMLGGQALTNVALMFGLTRRSLEPDWHLRKRLVVFIRTLGNTKIIVIPNANERRA